MFRSIRRIYEELDEDPFAIILLWLLRLIVILCFGVLTVGGTIYLMQLMYG